MNINLPHLPLTQKRLASLFKLKIFAPFMGKQSLLPVLTASHEGVNKPLRTHDGSLRNLKQFIVECMEIASFNQQL